MSQRVNVKVNLKNCRVNTKAYAGENDNEVVNVYIKNYNRNRLETIVVFEHDYEGEIFGNV